jgi:outer membrane lipoprotein LolB
VTLGWWAAARSGALAWTLSATAGLMALSGCASWAPDAGQALSGRLSLRVAADGQQAERGFNAGFDLRGSGDRGELRLSTVLGPQIAAARWSPGSVALSSSEGEQRFASLDDLAKQVLGEPVPLQALPDWLRGRAWPGAPAEAGALGFVQLGWQVDLARQADGFITASRLAAPAVVLRVRLDSR